MNDDRPAPGGDWPAHFDRWQDPLRHALFFSRDRTDPFILNLEEQEVLRLWPEPHDTARNLAKSVAAALDWNSKTDVFGPLRNQWERWQSTDRAAVPPHLGLLALTVAAAAEMHRDSVANSNAYFLRLAQLLCPGATTDNLNQIKDQLSASFDPVADWWRGLSSWIDKHPELGINTIPKNPKPSRIGYPVSQAVILRSDRMRLTHFYSKLDFPNLGVPSPSALLNQLKFWAATPRGLSPSMQAALGDEDRHLFLASYVHRLATKWDGVILTPEGTAQLDVRLAIDLDDFTARWVIKAHAGAHSLTADINGFSVVLTGPADGTLYEWHGPMPPTCPTSNGSHAVDAKGPGFSGRFDFPALLPMRADPDAGWLSKDDVRPFQPHIFLVAPEWSGEVEKVLQASARPGWRRIQQTPKNALVPGRAIYIRVEFEDEAAFNSALTDIAPLLAKALRPGGGFRPRLVSGLRVHTDLGPRHYLRGGEPDLLLPLGEKPRTVPAALDQFEQENPFLATGFPIPLRLVGPLAQGQHTISADGEILPFDVHDPNQLAEEGRIALGWRHTGPSMELAELRSSDLATSIIGGSVAGSIAELHLLRRRGRDYYVAGRHGQISHLIPPPPSPLFNQLGIPESMYWEYEPPFEAVWLFDRGAVGKPRARLLRYAEPHFNAIDAASRALWDLIAGQLIDTSDILDLYLTAWKRYRENDR